MCMWKCWREITLIWLCACVCVLVYFSVVVLFAFICCWLTSIISIFEIVFTEDEDAIEMKWLCTTDISSDYRARNFIFCSNFVRNKYNERTKRHEMKNENDNNNCKITQTTNALTQNNILRQFRRHRNSRTSRFRCKIKKEKRSQNQCACAFLERRISSIYFIFRYFVSVHLYLCSVLEKCANHRSKIILY